MRTKKRRAIWLEGIAVGSAAALVVATTGCGQVDQRSEETITSKAQPLRSLNGLSANGLSANGLSANGLSANGLSANGLTTTTFSTWFNKDVPTGDMVMGYVVRCAYASGKTLTWTNPTTKLSYTWAGALGLLPSWASGKAMTAAEKQVLTACLAAHVNGFGVHVDIAIEGRGATGVQLPIGATELTDYPLREAAFFGDLVTDRTKLFVCLDHNPWNSSLSSARACALDNGKAGTVATNCPPVVFTGDCSKLCDPDATNTFYETCTWNGVAYKALATRMRQADQFQCGDGVCQFTESCGTGATADNCGTDCGPCP